ncbi:hypothetical protein [Nonomuraea dietziae]
MPTPTVVISGVGTPDRGAFQRVVAEHDVLCVDGWRGRCRAATFA